MERKLATIQKVEFVEPIENSDNLELVRILGWQVVAKKGDFKPGQLCIYCEVDSILPERPEFEFLRAKHFRIKTIRLRGILSQGIAFPLDILRPEDSTGILHQYYNMKNEHIIGQDVTEKLGIVKYEPPISPGQKGNAKGNFPSYLVPKTDEMRIQSHPRLLEEIKGLEVYITEKEDGTSFTAIHQYCPENIPNGEDPHEIKVCSRNLELKPGDDVYWKIVHQYYIKEKLDKYYEDHFRNIAIQGEIIGAGIQGNPMNLHGQELRIFNIYDVDNQVFFDFEDFIRIARELWKEK